MTGNGDDGRSDRDNNGSNGDSNQQWFGGYVNNDGDDDSGQQNDGDSGMGMMTMTVET